MKYLIYIIVTLVLSGCSIYSPLPPSELNKNTKIGVIALTGDIMDLTLIGTTIFNNNLKEINIENWEIAEFFEQTTKSKLKEKSNMTISEFSYDRKRITMKSKSTNIVGDFVGYSSENIKDELRTLVSKNNLKYILVIEPSIYNGIELYKRQLFKSIKNSELKIYYSFELYDRKIERVTRFYIESKTKISNNIWDNGERKITNENLNYFESIVKNSINQNIEKPLLKIGLIK